MSLAFYALTIFFNNPHYFATIYRAYRTREDFSKYKIFTLHLTALLALTAVAAHWSASLVPWLYTVYLTWSPWHYAGQNFGLAMMFARRAEAGTKRGERNALYTASLASYLMLFITFHSNQTTDPFLVSLGLPASPARAAQWFLLAVFLITSVYAFSRLISRAGIRAMIAPLTLFSTQFLWFVLPTVLQIGYGARIPQARYSTGVLAFMHSAQYLWITSYYAKREALVSPQGRWRPLAYFSVLIVGGIALFVPGPWIVSLAFKYDFATSFLVFASLINIHHFILDGAIWKLRDSRIASLLIDTKSATRDAGATLWRWLAGSTVKARALRLTAAVLLIAFAGLDQSKFYLGASDRDVSNLTRASSLNPYDSQLHTRLARAWSMEGNLEARLTELRRAIEINPRNVAAQTSLAQSLIENKRWEEAYRHYEQMIRFITADSSMYFNFGVLASQLERDTEAIDHWKKSVALDNKNMMAHVMLAETYDRNRVYVSAIEHYEQFLLLLTVGVESETPDLESVLGVALKLAENYTLTSQRDRAIQYYEKIISLSEKSGENRYASLAWSRQASLYAEMNQNERAARCYQRALALDARIGDAKIEGADWFNYGDFLKRNRAADRVLFACFLKAEELLKSTGSTESPRATRERENAEKSLGIEASKVRSDLKTALDEALAYKF